MPILAICAGMQVIAGMYGAKLTSDIASYNNGIIDHFDSTISHTINISQDSLLLRSPSNFHLRPTPSPRSSNLNK